MNNLTKGKAILYLAAIIALAAAAGVAVGYSMATQKGHSPPFHPEEMSAHIRTRLQSKLELTPEQVAKINPLLEQTCNELRATLVRGMREVGEAFEAFNQKIVDFLTAAQKQKLADMDKERQDFMRKRCKPPAGASPPLPNCQPWE